MLANAFNSKLRTNITPNTETKLSGKLKKIKNVTDEVRCGRSSTASNENTTDMLLTALTRSSTRIIRRCLQKLVLPNCLLVAF